MERISNAANAASKAIWGEGQDQNQSQNTTTEPPSGQTGQGTPSDPYDVGNKDETAAIDSTGNADTTESTNPASSSPDSGEGANSADPTKTTGASMSGPEVGAAAPASGAAPQQKQQGADRPVEEPSSENAAAIDEKKDVAESAMQKEGDEEDHSGEPLDKSAKADDEKKDALGSNSKEGGTGEKYVKSTGVAAEGGDFDATNPGAGREADRLLEEKGVHREGNVTAPDDAGGDSSSKADKPSVGQKIKDKLHIGKKD